MNKLESLKRLIKESQKITDNSELEKYYIGTGNLNSNILIIGKEASINLNTETGLSQYQREIINNTTDWARDFDKKQTEIENWNGENYSPLYPYKNQSFKISNYDKCIAKNDFTNHNNGTSRTWYNYQKIHNLINKEDSKVINFHENFFLTELNSCPSRETRNANTKSLEFRKEYLMSEFFQKFPIVIIAGLGYLNTKENENEIKKIFNVEDAEDAKVGSLHKIWIHYSKDRRKIVINTRQLSSYISNDLLKAISTIINTHQFK